jgi:hypothetical protein
MKTFGEFRGQVFYRGMVSHGNHYANIFMVEQIGQLVDRENLNFFVDGTFSVAPIYFAQLLLIFCTIGEKVTTNILIFLSIYFNKSFQVYPLCLILMTSRSTDLYEKVFTFLSIKLGLQPVSIMCDFEAGMRKGMTSVWPSALISGCWFHHSQCLRRKKMSLPEMNKLVKHNRDAELIFNLFLKLPLLPKEAMQHGLKQIFALQKKHHLTKGFRIFNAYYVKNWIDRMETKEFNVSDLQHRTNNFAESFNAKLKRHIHRNPSAYMFLGKVD